MTILKLYNRNGNHYPQVDSDYRFNDMIGEFFREGKHSHDLNAFFPRTNFIEDRESFVLLLAVPGISKSNVRIDVEKDVLTISHTAEKAGNNEIYLRREFDFGNFERSFRIPEAVNQQLIKAKFEDGILKIVLPKKIENIDRGPKEIKIS